MKYVLLAITLLTLSACSESYRYPCQDPDNWDKAFCKKPYCSANGTCPEDLQHYEKQKLAPAASEVSKKEVCK